MAQKEFLTRFIFNETVIVEISTDYVDSVMVEVMDITDPEDGGRSFHLEPDEVDLMIAALNLYKNRIEKGVGKS
jgi:hypothetical protein